tara:strand:- start:1345 stop:1452 length:108 start_codon:yes stop_codon:yes gene_type:complete
MMMMMSKVSLVLLMASNNPAFFMLEPVVKDMNVPS